MSVGKYKGLSLLGEGTFGRVVLGERDGKIHALKIIRPVSRYIQSAKIELSILKDIKAKVESPTRIVKLEDAFYFTPDKYSEEHICLAFEPLGCSLFEIIKKNKYRGFDISQIKEIAIQILEGLS